MRLAMSTNTIIPIHERASPGPVAFVLGLIACAVLFLPVPASAFQIVPISQEFEPTGRGANQVFQVENGRDEPITVIVDMATRAIDIDGNETMAETEDFVVFPTELILEPGSARAVRVQWVGEAAPTSELAYRIIAEETPLNVRRETPGATVFLTIRYVGSIYVVPPGARPNVTVASARAVPASQGGMNLEVVLENEGTRHAIIGDPALVVTSGAVSMPVDKAALEGAIAGENILAGGQRRVLLPMPAGLPSGELTASFDYSVQ